MVEKKNKESEKHRGIVGKKYKMKELCETRKKRLSREINLLNSNKTGQGDGVNSLGTEQQMISEKKTYIKRNEEYICIHTQKHRNINKERRREKCERHNNCKNIHQ